ncbi:NB-ARC domain-containing protein [Photobacterium sp. SDRW27]|uniref:NB-ARC domain-containing protein n=1 Tax=Photobacterium obscurum TaxID=2829490 RepID=UPI002244039A|nr:NB-ARC domain-containing protein [Photobacterium obscurum]MCW8329080.1 NB-ARC domain-containing protein [Photobacterium obscurum]
MIKFLNLLDKKLELACEDSDFTFFFNLLVVGEAITKLSTLIVVSNVSPSVDRHQYRILHGIVRANGIGEWSKAIDDLLVGPASQYLYPEFRPYQTELTKKVSSSEWQAQAVDSLISAMTTLGLEASSPSTKKDLKSWFKLFTELRNKTRGHGAITSNEKTSDAAYHLANSINLIKSNSSLFKIESAYIKRNLSGKYRVSDLGNGTENFEPLKNKKTYSLSDGLYVFIGDFRKIPLIISDSELNDFYIANGSFSSSKYELLSYYSDNKKNNKSAEYLAPTGNLPPSESEGLGELIAKGNCFTNVPTLNYQYIQRQELEDQLYNLLLDDRRTIVTLLGRGGIGKTSLALKVIPRLYSEQRFDSIVWFSSRDIDLKEGGAKLVSANVVSNKDIAKYYCKLVLSNEEYKKKGYDYIKYFQEQLTESDIGSCLYIFDNFETTESPIEVFKWVDTYIRNPNKVLITTRLREFIGDYPLNVYGMTKNESYELIELTSEGLGVKCYLTEKLKEQIFSVSGGHPYIIKIMLGELSNKGMKGALPKIVAGNEEVLTALFERTYAALNPCTQRIFLTLSSWNSAIPRLALEAVMMASIDNSHDVEDAIDTLIQYSLAEEHKSKLDNQYFIVLPYTALAFGQKKVRVSPLKNIISSDVKTLQRFGVTKIENDLAILSQHISKFLSSLDNHEKDFKQHKDIIECIAYSYHDAWLMASEWLEESNSKSLLEEAKRYLLLFLETEAEEEKKVTAWYQLASIARKLKLPFDEIHALTEASQYSIVEFSELSNLVNTVNHLLNKPEFVIDDHDVKNELLSKLYDTVLKRKSEGDAVDCSRLAWLALHLDKKNDAEDLVTLGLKIDRFNTYCLKLNEKLSKISSTII